MATLEQIIVADAKRGKGVIEDPVRDVVQFWNTGGKLLSEHDPYAPTYEPATGDWKFRSGRYPGHHGCCSHRNKPVDECSLCNRLDNCSTVNLYLENLETVEDALDAAWTDLGHWLQLAERQFMSHNAPLCPTEAGIDRTKKLREQIGKALTVLRADSADKAAGRDE